MRSFGITFGALAISLFSLAPVAQANEWSIDPYHSAANFSVRHMMISNVRGDFSGVKGSANYDGKDVKSISVDATIDTSTISTGEPDRDKHLKAADFLDTAKYPVMTFKSKKVIPVNAGNFKLVGDLTLHGVTKEVTLDVEGPTPAINDGRGNTKIGASATAKINRKDFGIVTNTVLETGGVAIGEDINIVLDIEMSKKAPDKKAAK